jgi:hypothetical protein
MFFLNKRVISLPSAIYWLFLNSIKIDSSNN